jgi:multiple sugar transport system ATP-binding protein
VAGFLGSPSMNLIEGTLRSEANKLFFDASGFSMEIQTNKVKLKEKINQNLILGVRPEDLLISKAKKLDSIEAVVYAIEPMGNELLLTLEVGEDTLIARTKPTLEVKEEEKVSINIDKNRIHLFEKESEKSIF